MTTPYTVLVAPARMPFGRHRGKRIDDIDNSYLNWLLTLKNLQPWLRAEAQDVLCCRAEEARLAVEDPMIGVPTASPMNVYGVALTPHESHLWRQAQRTGTLLVPLWLPCASPLVSLWEVNRWESGQPCRVEEEQLPRPPKEETR